MKTPLSNKMMKLRRRILCPIVKQIISIVLLELWLLKTLICLITVLYRIQLFKVLLKNLFKLSIIILKTWIQYLSEVLFILSCLFMLVMIFSCMDVIIFVLSLIVMIQWIQFIIINFNYQNIGEKHPILDFQTWKIVLYKVKLE